MCGKCSRNLLIWGANNGSVGGSQDFLDVGGHASRRGIYSGIFEHRDFGTLERSPKMSFSFLWRPPYDGDFDFLGIWGRFFGTFRDFLTLMSIRWESNSLWMLIIWALKEHCLNLHWKLIVWAFDEHWLSILGIEHASEEHWPCIWRASDVHRKSIKHASDDLWYSTMLG